MNDEIRSLIDSIRRGQYEDPTEKISLLAAALIEQAADDAVFGLLLGAPQIPLRLAALEACRQRRNPALLPQLIRLASDADARVRTQLCPVLAVLPPDGTCDALKTLVGDLEPGVRAEAVKATAGRKYFFDAQRDLLRNDPSWSVRLAAVNAIAEGAAEGAAGELLRALAQDEDSDVRQRAAELLEKGLAHRKDALVRHLPTDIGLLGEAERKAIELGGRLPQLLEWLRSHTSIAVNPAELARFGTDLTALALAGTLPRAYRVARQVSGLLEMLQRQRVRSMALLGASGAGKSSLVHELVYALARPENGAWRVLRMSPTDFMAGTKYLGEWETKVRELVDAIRRPRRVVLYVPNLADLSAAGRWSKSDANVASALAPYLEDGSVLLLGESTPEEFERGLGGELALQRLFERVLVEEASSDDTRAILAEIRDAARAQVSDAVLDELQEMSGFFLSHLARPGNAATLLRAVIAAAPEPAGPITRRDLLTILSQSTGIPVDLLDDSKSLEQTGLRAFFEQRIMGQAEAVDAVVDVVTLIKAGLTDPQKPFNVLLFVGPTGVGKTELARALAEYIFGDAARLLRFDMSEFAGPDGFTRLIGGRGENGLLTDAVRQRPFSVVLLDEIEKSHINVFDLCLQIFDAGRLTDGRGRLVDFRRTIVILTSNVGAEAPGLRLGFGAGGHGVAEPEADRDRTMRELTRVFRPEFLNRLDRIVHFRPLSLEVAERIARRELDLVLQRSGVARRHLTVNVDPGVLALLVRQGHSPHFGARPLKRTVEQLVLLPLARSIAGGRAQPGSVLSLRADGSHIHVHLALPAQPPGELREEPARGAGAPLAASPWEKEREELEARCAALAAELRPLADRKSELVGLTREPGFYGQGPKRDAVFDELHKIDQFLFRCDRAQDAVSRLRLQAENLVAEADLPALLERTRELRSEVEQLTFVTRCREARDLSDAVIVLTRLRTQGANLGAVEMLARAYLGLAVRRRFEASVIAEMQDETSDWAAVQVLGLGAVALLAGESGLHQFNRRTRAKNPRTGREQTHEDNAVVRVEVLPLGREPDKRFLAAVRSKVTALKPARSRLVENAAWHVSAFHEPSVRSVEGWLPGTRADALAAALRLLHAQAEAAWPAGPGSEPGAGSGTGGGAGARGAGGDVVRRYELGIGSRIRDLRTGRTTTRLAHFFRGQIEMLVP